MLLKWGYYSGCALLHFRLLIQCLITEQQRGLAFGVMAAFFAFHGFFYTMKSATSKKPRTRRKK